MSPKETDIFCHVIKEARLPYGVSSNIGRCMHLKQRKIIGYKSHDAHILLHHLIPVAIRKSLPKQVAIPLIRLGGFFRSLCNKAIKIDDLEELEKESSVILCEFEKLFLPCFFDIMVHLPIHLVRQIKLGGPVHGRSMYFIERYLCKLKSYVRNRSRSEASIAQGYLLEERLNFCSLYMDEDVKTKINTSQLFEDDVDHSNDSESKIFLTVGHPLGGKKKRKGEAFTLDYVTCEQAHRYALFNTDSKDIDEYIK